MTIYNIWFIIALSYDEEIINHMKVYSEDFAERHIGMFKGIKESLWDTDDGDVKTPLE